MKIFFGFFLFIFLETKFKLYKLYYLLKLNFEFVRDFLVILQIYQKKFTSDQKRSDRHQNKTNKFKMHISHIEFLSTSVQIPKIKISTKFHTKFFKKRF